jgi:hypothetical protein
MSQQTWRSLSSASRMMIGCAPGRAGDLLADLAVQGQAHGFVEVALRFAEFDVLDDLALRRQLRGHLLLGAAQQEGADARGQVRQACLVAVALDGRAVVLGELAGVAEPAGQQEVEQRPEFAQVVFQRRAGQAQAVPRVQLARGLGGLGPGVLDVLRLVEDQQVVLLFAELLGVARQQRIGGEDQVMLGDPREVAAAAGAMQGEHAQLRGEALGFVQPVGDQAGRHHHQGRRAEAPGLFSRSTWASDCSVLPRPMSSARMPLAPTSRSVCIQLRPSCW